MQAIKDLCSVLTFTLPKYRPSLHYAMNSINLVLIASLINHDHTCSFVGGLGKA